MDSLPLITPPAAAIVLAAGNSSRLGQPKQLLVYQGETLLHRAVRTALAAGYAPVVVVTGALDAELRLAVAGLPCQAVHNPGWAAGMGASIRAGLAALGPAATAVLVMSSDQPLIEAAALAALAQHQQATGAPAVAAAYAEAFGIPALFAAGALAGLRNLRPEQGAKPLLASYGPTLALVPIPEAAFDVDTPAAYQALLAHRGPK
ncbi:NTP transferase domain-containing protein [Hymenobacter nivis]|nr:nucleotidyltransferase family protein [Hymenobacter nivis]